MVILILKQNKDIRLMNIKVLNKLLKNKEISQDAYNLMYPCVRAYEIKTNAELTNTLTKIYNDDILPVFKSKNVIKHLQLDGNQVTEDELKNCIVNLMKNAYISIIDDSDEPGKQACFSEYGIYVIAALAKDDGDTYVDFYIDYNVAKILTTVEVE